MTDTRQNVIENEFLRVAVKNEGAQMCEITYKPTNAPILWNGDPEVWAKHAPIMFPYCGRLKDDKFTKDGVEYEGTQHGFARDLNHMSKSKTATQLEMILEANVLTMEKFPYAFGLTSKFELEGKTLHHKLEVVNDSDEVMPFGIGYHPGFTCPFDENHKTEDYEIVFDSPQTPVVYGLNAQTSLMTKEPKTLFENATSMPLTESTFDDGCLIFTNLTSKTISLVEKGTGRKITVNIEGYPYVVLWSKPGPMKFLCIEPWHTAPDSEDASGVWAEKKPQIKLNPEEHFTTCMSMTFEM